ncbi:hypothetical protein KHA90_11940 [Flavobacterium psychroterrae]|uniref:Type VI secretion system lipoprotein TssJ n=1 Tax=Flavobacterium psychroterrae TaxID=2133767 RepID=A0ABS5PBR8_9FLAO|nr:hypothetical protein [Flavobacterium psychroterrae]MBS7231738.1 hypothetical protein [Flavobacterium psychroterrae]
MKKIIVLILLCVSCNLKSKKEEPCVIKMEYISQLDMLVPESVINVYIEDKEGFLQGKLSFKKLQDVILYSVREEEKDYFHLLSPYLIPSKTDKNIVILKVATFFFRPNVFIHGVRRENKWTPEQIQKAITGDVGFVFEKDTIRVKMCEK